MDNEEISGFEDSPSNMLAVVFMSVFLISFVYFMLVALNHSKLQSSQENFQRGLTNAVKAYSTTYSTTPEALKYLSEGYLIDEDLNIYGVDSNPIQINRNVASEYFFNILASNVPQSKALLKTCGVYIIDVITEYKPEGSIVKPHYKVSIYKDGVTANLVNYDTETLEGVQSIIEQKLGGIHLDIAKDFNASLRTAQKYKENESTTGDGRKTYSTYSTTMTIVKDVPMTSLFGFVKMDVKEIQTYSIKRGDS